MSRYLLIANQTLGGQELDAEIRQRVAEGDAEFHVVVPMTEPELEAEGWVPADPVFGVPATTLPDADALDEARRRSEHRLQRILEHLRDLGATADGEVGPSDPVEAARAALDRVRPDRVIVSTLPAGLSRWLKLDLPSRIARLTPLPVTTVEAKESPAA